MYISRYPIQSLCIGCAQVLDGLVKVLSLGYVGTMLNCDILCWFTKRRVKAMKKAAQ